MLKWFKRRYLLLGVDICPSSIKILAVSYHKNQFCIEDYSYVRFAVGSGGTSRSSLISAIKTLLSRFNASVKFAAIALPDSQIISKTIQIADNLTAIETERLILMEANKFLAGDISVDFSVLGSSKKNIAMLDVLLVATKTEHIQKRIELLKETGLDVKIVAIESQVIASVIKRLSTREESRIVTLIDIGLEQLSIYVFDNGEMIYRQDESFSLGIDKIKLHIKKSLQIFISTEYHALIGLIYLAGEVADLSCFAQEIEDQTGVTTTIANPFSGLTISQKISVSELEKIAPVFMIAVGLVLRLANEY